MYATFPERLTFENHQDTKEHAATRGVLYLARHISHGTACLRRLRFRCRRRGTRRRGTGTPPAPWVPWPAWWQEAATTHAPTQREGRVVRRTALCPALHSHTRSPAPLPPTYARARTHTTRRQPPTPLYSLASRMALLLGMGIWCVGVRLSDWCLGVMLTGAVAVRGWRHGVCVCVCVCVCACVCVCVCVCVCTSTAPQ